MATPPTNRADYERLFPEFVRQFPEGNYGPPDVPSPTQNQPLRDRPSGNSNSAANPTPKKMWEIKEKLLRPALTSHFQCWFNPPNDVANYIKNNRDFNYNGPGNAELISLSCSEASLPGSSLATNEINDDFTGVTEKLAYRRQYDGSSDFTFYVDHGRNDGNYNVLWYFENWIQYIANEQYTSKLVDIEAKNYNYRFRFPDGMNGGTGYRTTLHINKFERDYNGQYLRYKFISAYPISITSMPVSYDSSQLLKCTVSFTYSRYVVDRKDRKSPPVSSSETSSSEEPRQSPPKGVPEPPARERDRTQQFGKFDQIGYELSRPVTQAERDAVRGGEILGGGTII